MLFEDDDGCGFRTLRSSFFTVWKTSQQLFRPRPCGFEHKGTLQDEHMVLDRWPLYVPRCDFSPRQRTHHWSACTRTWLWRPLASLRQNVESWVSVKEPNNVESNRTIASDSFLLHPETTISASICGYLPSVAMRQGELRIWLGVAPPRPRHGLEMHHTLQVVSRKLEALALRQQ